MEAKALFYYYVGELNFRANRKREAEQKYGGTQCLVGTCCGTDSFSHVKDCYGYRTKPPSNMRDEDLGEFLLKLHRERTQRWNAPLLNVDVNNF